MTVTEPNREWDKGFRDLFTQPDKGLNVKQAESIRDSTGLVNIWEGAVSSGKTVASLFRFIMFVAQTADLPGEIVISGRTRESCWRNVILPMMQLYPDTVAGNMGAPTCTVMGQRAHVIGASDAKAESVLRGITCKAIYLDEVTTIPEGYFKMALSRLRVTGRRGGLASKLFGSTNPDNPMHWLKRDYLDKLDGDLGQTWRSFHFNLDDNPRLSPEYVTAMKAQYSGLFYQRFILGQWVQGEGAVWDTYSDDRHVVDISEVPKMERIISVGVDFGSNHQSAGLVIGLAQERLWVLAEWAPMRNDVGTLAPSVQSASFRAWLESLPPEWREPEFIFVDSAALAFRDQLFVDGLPTAPAWKGVKEGLQLIHSLFTADRIRIMDSCVNLRREIPSYVWDAKAVARGEDAPVKEHDDFCDALRYGIGSSRPQWQGLIPLIFPTPDLEAP